MPSNKEKSDLAYLVELAERRVRTLAGSKLYGQPIGSVIGGEEQSAEGEKRPTTIERLKSLQRQFLAAKRTGNEAAMKDVQAQFTEAFREYTKNHQAVGVLSQLQNQSGNHEQDIQAK